METIKIKKFLILILLLLCFIAIDIQGEELKSSERYNRILFVMDCSGSMNENDVDRISSEMVKMFVDGMYSSKTDIGFVTFSNKILTSYPLTSIEDLRNRKDIKSKIDSIERIGGTDIGTALNHGMDMFLSNPKDNSNPVIIFFSDGDTEYGGMVNEHSAFQKSKQIGCPIYTVGLSQDGSLNTEYLKNISSTTGGKEYEIMNSDEFTQVFRSLFQDITGKNIIERETIKGSGEMQSIIVDMPNYYVDESNIFLLHNGELKDFNVEGGLTYNSNNFSSVKMLKPENKSVEISFIASKDSEIKVNLVNFTEVYPKIEMPKSLATKKVEINSKLYSKSTGEVLADPSFYEENNAELVIQDAITGENMILEMNNSGETFSTVYDNLNPRSCNAKIIVFNNGFSIESENTAMVFSNTPPVLSSVLNRTAMYDGRKKEYDLNDFFVDSDGDELYFEIVEDEKQVCEIESSRLIINSKDEGNYLVSVSASDNRGGVIMGKLNFSVVPIWIYFRNVIIGVLVIFVLLLILYLMFFKKGNKKATAAPLIISSNAKFNGSRFEGYFLNTLSGNDIPVLNWNSSYIDNKRIFSLGDLFSISDVEEKIPESYKIYFRAGNNGNVIFYHNTGCVVSLSNRNIPRGKREVLKYDDRIYIVFEDHVTEIEIRYKRVRNTNISRVSV